MSKVGEQVLVTLRKLIASGELAAGARMAEIPTAERLNVSRQPVRMAFRALAQEGLLEPSGARGYRVRQVTTLQIVGAVEVRGVLEGLAARQVAQNGLSVTLKKAFSDCLKLGDALFDKGYLTEPDLVSYQDMNNRFHQLLLEASANPAIGNALSRNDHLPFASVRALTADRENMAREYVRLKTAHAQHHQVFEALLGGDADVAERLMRDHARATLAYIDIYDRSVSDLTEA
ncbi:MAG: GntR family transcriptional regulator [Asticcacaulis sp.]